MLLLVFIMTIMIVAVGCAQQKQNEKPPSDNQKTVQSATEEQSESGSPSMEKEEKQKESAVEKASADAKVSVQKNGQVLDDTLNTLNELEETINSLDEVSDSDLQIAE